MNNNPTAAQQRRHGKVAALGCLACAEDGHPGTPAQVHHCKEHGYRNHDKVAPLCPPHHGIVDSVPGVINRHKNPVEFRGRYGTDEDLHIKTCILLGETP